MFLKLPGYIGLSILSFCVFTWIFHTVDQVQAAVISPEIKIPRLQPSPTIYLQPTVPQQTIQIKKNEQPLPTPTVFIAPDNPTPIPTDVPVKPVVIKEYTKPSPTSQPVLSTAIPSPTVAPTAIPPTTAAIPAPADLETLFAKYSGEFAVDVGILKKIAKCESGFNPNANNSGMYLGMFQFGAQTWSANRARMGLDTNPDLRTNAEEAIRTAAYVISRGGIGAWPNCH